MTTFTDEPTSMPTLPSPKLLRQWALAKGLPVGKRGKIPADIYLAYQEATR